MKLVLFLISLMFGSVILAETEIEVVQKENKTQRRFAFMKKSALDKDYSLTFDSVKKSVTVKKERVEAFRSELIEFVWLHNYEGPNSDSTQKRLCASYIEIRIPTAKEFTRVCQEETKFHSQILAKMKWLNNF